MIMLPIVMEEAQAALKRLGHRIRRHRLAQSLSQEEFAYRANLDRSYIGQIERGERNLAFGNLFKIATALGLSLSDLMAEKE